MAQHRRGFLLARGTVPLALWLCGIVLGAIVARATPPQGQAQPLSLSQVERLVQIRTPDNVVATNIRERGLDFVPTKDTLDTLQRLGAGPETLQAVDALRPMLDGAKGEIPGILKQIYQALDQGNPQAIRPLLTAKLVTDSGKLDAICKPFTYRAHYIEAIFERPQRQFEVRVRVLFRPLDEHAYVLLFGVSQDHFFLQDIRDPPESWFGPEKAAATEQARRFVYALNAGRKDIVSTLVTPSLLQQKLPDVSLKGRQIAAAETHETRLFSYNGIKVRINVWVWSKEALGYLGGEVNLTLLFDRVSDQVLIVAWEYGYGMMRDEWTEDKNLETYTLRRFSLHMPATIEAPAVESRSPARIPTGMVTPATPTEPSQPSGVGPPPAKPATGSATCGDYDACLRAGISTFQSSNWQRAIADFEAASNQRRSEANPWGWLGRVYLAMGQGAKAPPMWDKALNLGPLTFVVCHERAVQSCERGNLSLGPSEVSFIVVSGGRELFSAPPSQIKPTGVRTIEALSKASFGLRVEGRNYDFDFLPFAVTCDTALFVQCPPQGVSQQVAVGNYISQAIPKLASGALGSAPKQPSTTMAPAAASPAATLPSCSQAVDLGYSILADGHLYKVKGVAAADGNRIPVFLDEKEAPVTQQPLLAKLALGAWAHDNIVASSSTRSELANKSKVLSGIIGTSLAIERYEAVQDLLARAMTEATEAAVTGGASLAKAVPNVASGILWRQLLDSPRTLFALAARIGLQRSLDKYTELIGILPPSDATALDAATLGKMKDLYTQARTLELPNEALAAALMPTSALELSNQALQSVMGELAPGLQSANPNEAVTLEALLKLQKSLGQGGKSLHALQSYNEKLNLALNLAQANDGKIEAWARQAASACTTRGAAKAVDPRTLDFLKERGWPTSERLQIRGLRGTVDVRNPYLALIDTEEGLVIIGKTDGYTVLFENGSRKFEMRVFEAPFAANRTAAEQQLLGILGVPASEACGLNMTVLDYTHDARNATTSLPSFCGSVGK